MNAQPPLPSNRFSLPVLIVIGILAAGGTAFWVFWPEEGPPKSANQDREKKDLDPRMTWKTSLLNVHPKVGYVGDSVCAQCHDHGKRYEKHAMGRSMRRPDVSGGGTDGITSFVKNGIHFEIDSRKGTVVHRARRATPEGKTLYEVEAPVALAIGSGERGTSYLVERDGMLFQSPISWFAQRRVWDLSPGFPPEQHFDRPIVPECLFCHAQHAEALEGSVNRYREPVRFAQAIGCERCHGPGELHAANPLRENAIVNPGKLPPPLREDVCHQCHLQGEQRVVRRGLDTFAYRPGLPLPLFRSHFVRQKELRENKAVSHVEQFQESRCFVGSDGKMGCISCHDPHGSPAAANKSAYFRQRCRNCHQDGRSCSASKALREKTSPANDCVVCHMPRQASTDIVHTAVTDHRILRHPGKDRETHPMAMRPGMLPLVYFSRNRMDIPPAEEVDRDLALALVRSHFPGQGTREELVRRALPGLGKALERDPGDLAAGIAKGQAEMVLGRYQPALDTLGEVLRRQSDHETALWMCSHIHLRFNRHEQAANLLARLVEPHPWSTEYRATYAFALLQIRNWKGAADQAEKALSINPAHLQSRRILAECLLRMGDAGGGEREFRKLVDLSAASTRPSLRTWWQGLAEMVEAEVEGK